MGRLALSANDIMVPSLGRNSRLGFREGTHNYDAWESEGYRYLPKSKHPEAKTQPAKAGMPAVWQKWRHHEI